MKLTIQQQIQIIEAHLRAAKSNANNILHAWHTSNPELLNEQAKQMWLHWQGIVTAHEQYLNVLKSRL